MKAVLLYFNVFYYKVVYYVVINFYVHAFMLYFVSMLNLLSMHYS